jgi:DNA-binding response OmpR family regulator
MPEQDGVETTRQIREIVGKDTPIIILTSYNWDDVFEEAKDAGVDSFVPKPLFAGNVMDEFQHQFKKKAAAQNQAKADLTGRHILLAEDIAVCSNRAEWLGAWDIAEDRKLVVTDNRIYLEESNTDPEVSGLMLTGLRRSV